MDLPSIKITHSGRTLYLTSMTAEQLISCASTDEWQPEIGFDIETKVISGSP